MPGTSPDLTVPPVVGNPQADVKPPPNDPFSPDQIAGALAARRESTTIVGSTNNNLLGGGKEVFRESLKNAGGGDGDGDGLNLVNTANGVSSNTSRSGSSSPSLRKTKTKATTMKNTKRGNDDVVDDVDSDLKQFAEDNGHFSLVRNFRLADLITLMNSICGTLSVLSSSQFLLTGDLRYLWAGLWLPFFGMFFDFLDGRVARWRGESSMLGQELDSLADSLSFGLCPSLLGFTLGLRTPLDCLILSFFVSCGIARLARFNATVALVPKDGSGKSKYFEGLPIPSSLGIVGVLGGCVRWGWMEGLGLNDYNSSSSLGSLGSQVGGVVDRSWETSVKGLPGGKIEILKDLLGVEVHWFVLIYLVWGMAMVSKTLRVPKP